MDKKQGKVDFVWRYQPLKTTTDGVLLSYIKSNVFMPPREMVLQALRAYWLPLAYQEKGDLEPILLERMFRKAVYALEKHALYLCDQAGIDYPVNPYRETETPIHKILAQLETLPQTEKGLEATTSASKTLKKSELTTDELFELVGGDEFDDSGFS